MCTFSRAIGRSSWSAAGQPPGASRRSHALEAAPANRQAAMSDQVNAAGQPARGCTSPAAAIRWAHGCSCCPRGSRSRIPRTLPPRSAIASRGYPLGPRGRAAGSGQPTTPNALGRRWRSQGINLQVKPPTGRWRSAQPHASAVSRSPRESAAVRRWSAAAAAWRSRWASHALRARAAAETPAQERDRAPLEGWSAAGHTGVM